MMVLGADPVRERLAGHLREVCERAAAVGLRVALEVVHFTAVGSLTAARELAALVDHDGFRLVLDALHLQRAGEDPEDVAATAGLVAVFQACDAPADAPDDLFTEAVRDRLVPGEGGLPLAALIGALAPDVAISVEVPSDAMWADLGPCGVADRSLAGLRQLLAPSLSM